MFQSATSCLSDYCDVFQCDDAAVAARAASAAACASGGRALASLRERRFACEALFDRCLPPPARGGPPSKEHDAAIARYCAPLVPCEQPKHPASTGSHRVLFWLALVAVLLLLLVFYLVYYCTQAEVWSTPDLRELQELRPPRTWHAAVLDTLRSGFCFRGKRAKLKRY